MLIGANIFLLIFLTAALLPAILLMRYIYRMDKAEHEPIRLLFSCVLGGIWAALASIVLETIGEGILDSSPLTADSEVYIIVLAFVVVAAVEEGTKLFFLRRKTWNDPNFDYHFDGIVYAVFVSLGFAAFENLKYVGSYGLGVALPRAILAIPAHMSFAVLMGIFYARAKHLEKHNIGFKGLCMFLAWFLPTLLHGIYDACAMISSETSTILFVFVVAVIYIIIFLLVRKRAKSDHLL